MGGNTVGNQTDIHYALRVTFGVVHGVLLTLCSFGLALFFPSLSQFLFAVFGCIVIPLLSFLLTIFCSLCIFYVSSRGNLKDTPYMSYAHILNTAWIPPVGIFVVNLVILPLEMMPSLGFSGPINTLLITSIVMNLILTTILQIYVGRKIQEEISSKSPGVSGPT
jgi:hypothetical protein